MLLELCFTVFAVLLLLLLHFLFSRRPVCQGGKSLGEVKPPIHVLLQNPEAIRYDCQDLHAPKVSGRLFKFLIWLGYTPFGKLTIVSRIKRESNLDRMGGVYIPEKPTPTPPIPPDMTDYSKPNEKIIRRMLDKEIEQTLSDSGFRFPTVADYIRAFRSGVCTPTDIAKAVLAAIEDSNAAHPPLRAIVDSNRVVVLAMAEASTERWRTGKTLSVLDGIPVAVKGEYRIEPYAFHAGTLFEPAKEGIPEALAVQKLKSSGAVIIGVANMQEFGAGALGSNPNAFHQTARNPYNRDHYPGGSSSGSAASVAAGLCPIALGADGGGSIRIPATLCGVIGIKPTNHFIDGTGLLPLTHTVCAPGPLGSSVLDVAIALDNMSREAEGDAKYLSLEELGEAGLKGVTVGVYWEFFEHADKEIVARCKQAVNQLQSLGATIIEIKIPELEDTRVAHFVTIVSEMTAATAVTIDRHYHEVNLESHLSIGITSTMISAMEYVNAQKQRTRAIEGLKHIFEKVDMIVTPGTACVAPSINPSAIPLGESDAVNSGKLMRFSFLANLTGIPGIVLPVGYTSGGLPIGLQLMGRWYEERVLLKAAWAMENSGAFPLKKPQVFYDLIQTTGEK